MLESLFNKGCSCEYCEHFKDTYLEEYLRTTAPEYILEYGVLVKFHSKFKLSIIRQKLSLI